LTTIEKADVQGMAAAGDDVSTVRCSGIVPIVALETWDRNAMKITRRSFVAALLRMTAFY
jgi:UDP-3-O-[3-hydroxymyristoyl] glucosamine N-acyltransferase